MRKLEDHMIADPNPMAAGGPPAAPPGPMGQGGAPSLGNVPEQGSALGGSPAGLGGSPDPMAILARAQQLLKSGAISPEQFQMIVAKLGLGGGSQGAAPQTPPAGIPSSTPPSAGAPPPGPAAGPSPQWNQ